MLSFSSITASSATRGLTILLLTLSLLAIGCGGSAEPTGSADAGDRLTGTVSVDGSSTVFPITEAVAEEFRAEAPDVRVPVGASGTGGGFKKFINGETDINDASRPIKGSEAESLVAAGIGFVELPVAFDGVSVIVNPENDFVDSLTVEELNAIWKPESTVKTWSQVRAGWPDEDIALFGPGADSGTFDYFTEAINGDGGASRSDYTASEDDNVIVTGVAGDKYGIGYLGYAYYVENKNAIKVVPVDPGTGPVAPSATTINDGSYAPLARPIYIYVSVESAKRPEVERFVEYYLEQAPSLVAEVGYVALPDSAYAIAKQRFAQRVSGSVYASGDSHGVDIDTLFSRGLN